MAAVIVFLSCLQLALSQDCESGDVAAMVQLQRQTRANLTTTFAESPVPITGLSPTLPTGIPDFGYPEPRKPPDETGARCVTFDVTGIPSASSMSVQVALDHTWVNDLVIWIVSPSSGFSVMKLGAGFGPATDLEKEYPLTFITSASTSQSRIGITARQNGVACKADPSQCSFQPTSVSGSVGLDSLAAAPEGTWKLCIGDDAGGRTGKLWDFNLWIPAFDPNAPPPGDVAGDPHIHSLRGAHYTLLQEGIFTAWNFTKTTTTEKVNWQLFAAYLGRQFSTQGLLLVNKNSREAMEIMVKDCIWRVKHHDTWSKASRVQGELKKSAQGGATNFNIKEVKEKMGNSPTVQSTIVMSMKSQRAMEEVAKLLVHCKPQHHLDFKIKMSHKDDIKHVGGELAVDPDEKSNDVFLFAKQGVMEMRTDHEFKASGTWVTLGGRPETDQYFNFKKSNGTFFLQKGCDQAQEEDAKTICAKYLEAARHPDVFADCVFDVCRGGDETFAQNAAAFIAA